MFELWQKGRAVVSSLFLWNAVSCKQYAIGCMLYAISNGMGTRGWVFGPLGRDVLLLPSYHYWFL
ncbi:hypothetical protein DHC50_20590 [Arenibacter sp. A80]|nr:hypothetical protein [Arenibacter sp. A80]